MLKFGQYFAPDVWFTLYIPNWILVEILKLCLVKILKFKFSRNADIWLKLLLGRYYEDEIWSRFFWTLVKWYEEVTLVTRTQPSGPLCLWQCFHTPSKKCKLLLFVFWIKILITTWGDGEEQELTKLTADHFKVFHCELPSNQMSQMNRVESK